MLSILCVRLTIKVKVGDTREFQSRTVPPPKNWVESPLINALFYNIRGKKSMVPAFLFPKNKTLKVEYFNTSL